MESTKRSERYKELDALRGIAALLVVFYHFTMNRPEAELGFELGITGVDLFFIISGFVIYRSIENARNGLDFVINRVSRLFPTYWTCVSFTFVMYCLHKTLPFTLDDLFLFLGNLSMFQFYLKINHLDEPYWTMIVEMLFYIGMLLLFHFKLLKYLNYFAIGLIIFVLMSSWLNIWMLNRIVFWIPILQFAPLFFSGTLYYKIFTEKDKLITRYVLIFFCLVCQVLLFDYVGRSRYAIDHYQYLIMLIIYFTCFTLFVNNKLFFIVNKLTLFLGKISFALYLVHYFVSYHYIIPFLTETLQINFWIAAFLIACPTVILLAALITYFVEIPLGKKMKEGLRAMAGFKSSITVASKQA